MHGRSSNEIIIAGYYENACRELAKVRSVIDVKEILNSAIGMKAYAAQAKNKQLLIESIEVREIATRKIGWCIDQQRQTVGLSKGAREKGTNRGMTRVEKNPASLSEAGIDKNLAKRARWLWNMTPAEFKEHLKERRETALSDLGQIITRARKAKHVEIMVKRKARHAAIAEQAATQAELQEIGPFALIYADPPWTFETHTPETTSRMPDDHYPPMTDDEIATMEITGKRIYELVHDDSILFMWCTSSNIKRAIEVLERWGFEYKTNLCWDKVTIGTGLIFRNQHEILLVGTRGKFPKPMVLPSSVFREQKTAHSVKPAGVRKLIEQMYPELTAENRIELFARGGAEGWLSYGFES